MAVKIDEVVDVDVSIGSPAIATAVFDVPLFVAGHAATTNRVDVYTSIDGVLADHAEGSPVYRFAENCFSGKAAPTYIHIGRRAITNLIATPAVADDTDYSVTVKSGAIVKTFVFDSGTGATATSIVTGLKALISADVDLTGKVTPSGTTTLILTPVVGQALSASVGSTLALVPTYAETATVATAAIRAVNPRNFFLSADDHTEATLVALAGYASSNGMKHVYSTANADVYNSAILNDIASQLQDSAYPSLGMYAEDADLDFPEGGLIGAVASNQAGTYTLEYSTMSSVAVGDYTPTQRQAMDEKNIAYYDTLASLPSVLNSKQADGQFLDTGIFTLWLKARIGEEVFATIKRETDLNRKVAYNAAGKQKIDQAIWSVLNRGLANGAISPDIKPIVRIPTNSEISIADRANRHLPDVVVELLYSNAIHTVKIRAYVSI